MSNPSRAGLAAALGLACVAGPAIARADEPPAPWPRVDVAITRVIGLPHLEARSPDDWRRVDCVLPCVAKLDPRLAYRISGDGVVDSDPFRLPAGADPVRVDVVPGSTMLRDLGSIFAVSGLVFVAGGGSVLLWPNAADATSDAKTSKAAVGVGVLSMGAIAVAVGVLLRTLSDTSVTVSPASSDR